MRKMTFTAAVLLILLSGSVSAETPEQWIALGRRVHGGFGSLIALGIHIGTDAQRRLNASPRELDVIYQDGPQTPCACVVDGIMIATTATPGRNSLHVMSKKAGKGIFGIATIKNTKTGKALRYIIPVAAGAFLNEANQKPERKRYDAVMNAPEASLFKAEALLPSDESSAMRSERKVAHQ